MEESIKVSDLRLNTQLPILAALVIPHGYASIL